MIYNSYKALVFTICQSKNKTKKNYNQTQCLNNSLADSSFIFYLFNYENFEKKNLNEKKIIKIFGELIIRW